MKEPPVKSGSDNDTVMICLYSVLNRLLCQTGQIWKFQLRNRPFNPVTLYDSPGTVSAQIGIFLFFLYLGNVIQRHSVAFLHLFIEFLIIGRDIGIVQSASITA